MNWQHLTAILWLRWRLSYNQWRRAGALNAILTVLIVSLIAVSSVLAFFLALIGGILGLRNADPTHLLFLWDALVLVFFFLWMIGLVTELQRSEFLSLDKLLHLPISLTGAFVLNYFSSLVSLTVIVFVASTLGLSLAGVVTHGPSMLLLFPLVLSFLLLVTAVTYQFRGWLATLMANKRRRRTVIMLITIGFIFMSQLPNLANIVFMRGQKQQSARQSSEQSRDTLLLNQQLQEGKIDPQEHARRLGELQRRRQTERDHRRADAYRRAVDYALIGNLVIPLGWLPLGVRAAAAGSLWPGMLGVVGMTLLGAASLWRAYRTTLGFYTGTGSRAKRVAATRPRERGQEFQLLALRVPGLSEHASAVALATFRSLLRAPEAKMGLLTPVILVAVFGSMLLLGPGADLPSSARPFLALAAVAMTMFGLTQMMINLFGFDRHGFRAFVLWPVPRQEILLGKNMAIAPLMASLALTTLVLLQIVVPLRATHLLATLVQLVPVYLLFCLIGNGASILAPAAISAGSLKPVQPKLVTMLLQMLCVMLSPGTLLPAAAALGIEMLLVSAFDTHLPIYLVFSVLEAAVVVWLYRALLEPQGRLLQQREPLILEIVASHTE